MYLQNIKNRSVNPSFMTLQTYRRFAAQSAEKHDVSAMVPALPMYRESPKDKMLRRKSLSNMLSQWKLMVGLEFHVHIDSPFKMFSSSRTSKNDEPNLRANYVDFACPGMLPVLNEDCLDKSIKTSLALAGRIPNYIKFDRKHYQYPDNPQGYQITQKHNPIMTDGRLFFFDCYDQMNHVLIERVQMEHDSAKTIKKPDGKWYLDYNRSGMPMLEIVTGAKWTNPEDCKLIVREMQELLQQLEISDAMIKDETMRLDINLSVHGEKVAGPRIEIKSIDSAKNVERAIEYEYRRQVALMEKGLTPDSETRQFDKNSGTTTFLRPMQESPDYRFFQDPDIPLVKITNDRISTCHSELHEVPFEVKRRFCNSFGLDIADTKIIFKNPWSVEMYTRIVWSLQVDPKIVFLWIYKHIRDDAMGMGLDFQETVMHTFGHHKFVDLISMINDKKVTQYNARQVSRKILGGDERMPNEIAADMGLIGQVSTTEALLKAVDRVVGDNDDVVQKYLKKGRDITLMSLVGKLMSDHQEKVDPVHVKKLILKKIQDDAQNAPKKAHK